jgi:hypothetical protein
MQKEEILNYFNDFVSNYDQETRDLIWEKQSQIFKNFWKNRILNKKVKELSDIEIDEIIRILDRQGRGNTAEDEAVARVMIAQGAWRRMFNGFKEDSRLAGHLSLILIEKDDSEKINEINRLYKYNSRR